MSGLTCYHFAGSTLRDGTPLPERGETLGPIEDITICVRGYHGSSRAIDALAYAPGSRVARVRLHGQIYRAYDKTCASLRTNITDYVDASDVLRLFARRCALDVVHLWDAPDVAVRYLNTGDEHIRAAAGDAAWDAARAAVWDAAWAAAWAAAGDAPWSTARAAAWDAAWAAAGAAARAAAGDAPWSTARAAAWDAPWSTARAKQNRRLVAMLAPLWKAAP